MVGCAARAGLDVAGGVAADFFHLHVVLGEVLEVRNRVRQAVQVVHDLAHARLVAGFECTLQGDDGFRPHGAAGRPHALQAVAHQVVGHRHGKVDRQELHPGRRVHAGRQINQHVLRVQQVADVLAGDHRRAVLADAGPELDREGGLEEQRVGVNHQAHIRHCFRQIRVELHRVGDGRRLPQRQADEAALRAKLPEQAHLAHRLLGAERGDAGEHRHPAAGNLDDGAREGQFFLQRQCGALAGGAVGGDRADAGGDQLLGHARRLVKIDRVLVLPAALTFLARRRDHGGHAADIVFGQHGQGLLTEKNQW